MISLNSFAQWLYATAPSVFLRSQESWLIPTIQSIHILGIATAVGSAFMISLRVAGLANTDQTLLQTRERYWPWLAGALWLLLGTGALLVMAEPPRELDAVSFWMKMTLVALMAAIAFAFQRSVRRHDRRWEFETSRRTGVKWLALLTLVIWAAIILLGRLIAYDQIWGHLSPASRA